MFYETYEKLCSENGEKPYQLPLKLGAKSNSVVAQWQKGSVPRGEMLQKIATHFNVSVEYLLTGGDEKETSPVHDDTELIPGYSQLNEQNKAKVREYIALLAMSEHKD